MDGFERGKKVKFLYLEGEGEIIKPVGDGIYLVRNQEGFEIEIHEDELLPIKPTSAKSVSLERKAFVTSTSDKRNQASLVLNLSESRRFPKEDDLEDDFKEKDVEQGRGNEKAKLSSSRQFFSKAKTSLKEGIYFGLRETTQKDVYQLILLNHTPNSLLFVVGEKKGRQIFLLHHGKLKPKQGVRITDVRKEELPYHLFFQGIAVPPSNPFQPLEPFVHHLTINGFTSLQQVPYFPNPVSLHKVRFDLKPLSSSFIDPIHVKENKAKPSEASLSSMKIPFDAPSPGRLEIDLHIEVLRKKDYYTLKKEEILSIQLEEAQKAIDEAILKQIPEIVFIHGIGQSILKKELHRLFREHPYVQDLETLIGPPYKGGATLVRLLL